MTLSRLLYYKSDMPVSYLPRRKPNSPVFDNPELNRLIDDPTRFIQRPLIDLLSLPFHLLVRFSAAAGS